MIYNGTYTVVSPSGDHRTLEIRTQADKADFLPGKRIISMLTGPNNEVDYTGFGFVTDQGIRVWKKQQTDFYLKVTKMLWSLLEDGASSPYRAKGVEVMVEKRCLRCNRKLTTPESIERGIGPECASRL